MEYTFFQLDKCALRLLLLTLVLLQSTGSVAGELSELVGQRLDYMRPVAAYKWRNHLPVENSKREVAVIANAEYEGLRFALDTRSSRHFFRAQIDAAKEVQRYWFTQWENGAGTPPDHTADLDADIRPKLIQLGNRISEALAGDDRDLTTLKVEGLSAATVARLDRAAMAVNVYPDRLAQVLGSGLLRVGTTGDYPPFSLRVGEEPRTGVDIEQAKNLARTLGVKIEWVPTSWPRLMEDYSQGRFDIGMSGISITRARQKTAFFSRSYHRGGKTPLIRCEDRERYSSLDAIDSFGTRLIVNPGGTNQQFVAANIRRATVLVHDDNRSIFGEIINNNADVMITDQIEVRLQAIAHPQLCPALGDRTLTRSEKGYLLPPDSAWKAFVDKWLESRLSDGSVDRLFARYLPR